MSLPPVRRVVTGHTADGKAIFESDENLSGVDSVTKAAPTDDTYLKIALMHRTTGHPPTLQGPKDETRVNNLHRPEGSGIVFETVDVPPASKARPVSQHRNQSLDYGVVLKGSIVLTLEDGVETVLKEGDVYVQK